MASTKTNVPTLKDQLKEMPFGDFVQHTAFGIIEAQQKLDRNLVDVIKKMAGMNESDKVSFGTQKYSLIELGFEPRFYEFSDTVIEMKMALSTKSGGEDASAVTAAPVNAGYCAKYQYDAQGAAMVRTTLKCKAVPDILEERVRQILENQAE